ncbi:BAD_collapsed_G0051700.mRNA.1.CDS.1 [Saccharomyces cerevisiae]|nr:BAD_HP_G0042260.mRNA.1.CDS.1 [Saccharomyces cerevisiae]CAI4987676.1 BAD_HP_G0056380.mRNA.1.CDS.1 [Saccharomyces cerevisiae]CAI6737772.1 BAD_HP_G0042260.mRNA.1.CDS.1 [Saccharomyces cerevisiae]CAI6851261.1 BAD_HP_G0056380.mRNA.1.CDS.1 [Saccharomyces cerevisiae]CAI7467925.1 BAD_collapsed_G0051700.mRNA.1.CDS.1 [Saccharomyces cerevisiae]
MPEDTSYSNSFEDYYNNSHAISPYKDSFYKEMTPSKPNVRFGDDDVNIFDQRKKVNEINKNNTVKRSIPSSISTTITPNKSSLKSPRGKRASKNSFDNGTKLESKNETLKEVNDAVNRCYALCNIPTKHVSINSISDLAQTFETLAVGITHETNRKAECERSKNAIDSLYYHEQLEKKELNEKSLQMAIDHLLKVTKQNLRQADDGNKLKETEALKSFIEEIGEVDDNKISINSLQQQLLEEKTANNILRRDYYKLQERGRRLCHEFQELQDDYSKQMKQKEYEVQKLKNEIKVLLNMNDNLKAEKAHYSQKEKQYFQKYTYIEKYMNHVKEEYNRKEDECKKLNFIIDKSMKKIEHLERSLQTQFTAQNSFSTAMIQEEGPKDAHLKDRYYKVKEFMEQKLQTSKINDPSCSEAEALDNVLCLIESSMKTLDKNSKCYPIATKKCIKYVTDSPRLKENEHVTN